MLYDIVQSTAIEFCDTTRPKSTSLIEGRRNW